MDLAEIRTFVAVADAGSVNRAARELRLSQPAVSRQVQRLEAALGAKLLDRRARPTTLTPMGRIALEQCRLVLRAVDGLRAATLPEQGPSGDCRLGVSPALADLALAEPIDQVRRLFPRVRFHVTTAWSPTLLEDVRVAALDAAVVLLPEGERPPAGLAAERLGSEPLVFVAPHRRHLSRVLDLGELADARWVLSTDRCGCRTALRRALERVGAPLPVAVEVYGFELQLSLVARGVGFGLVPARVLARSRLRTRLRAFRVRGHDFRLTAWSVRGRPPAALASVLAMLDAALARVLRGRGTTEIPSRAPRPAAAARARDGANAAAIAAHSG